MTSSNRPPRIFLIRHGDTEWARSGRHTSETDLPLLPEGETEARELGVRLRETTFSYVLTSPRLRARRTCELAGLSATAQVEPDLSEWRYGDYEGKTAQEINGVHPGWSIYRDGCPNGESPDDVSLRADRMLARVRVLSGNVAVFSHGHFLRILTARWVGWPIAHAASLLLSTGSLGILGYNLQRLDRPVIELWNERGPAGLRGS